MPSLELEDSFKLMLRSFFKIYRVSFIHLFINEMMYRFYRSINIEYMIYINLQVFLLLLFDSKKNVAPKYHSIVALFFPFLSLFLFALFVFVCCYRTPKITTKQKKNRNFHCHTNLTSLNCNSISNEKKQKKNYLLIIIMMVTYHNIIITSTLYTVNWLWLPPMIIQSSNLIIIIYRID